MKKPNHKQETKMEDQAKSAPEAPAADNMTAKQMAEMEALNAQRARDQITAMNQRAEQAKEEPVTLIEVAARGYDALHEAFRQHNERVVPEYVPPPRTARQMSALQEELEAGRKAQQRAEAQQASRPAPVEDPVKEGFTTPVYRPSDVVPDPTIPATGGSVAGTRTFGSDAP